LIENQPKQQKIGIGIRPAISWPKSGRLVISVFQKAGRRPGSPPIQQKTLRHTPGIIGIIVNPTLVPDKLADRDLVAVADVIGNGCREVIGNHQICVEAAIGLQLSSDDPSEHFGGTPNAELMVRSHGRFSLHVCPSDAAEKIRSGSLNEQDRAWHSVLVRPFQDR
jgi:hypothetical protein